MPTPITAFYAGLLAILLVVLGLMVVRARMTQKIAIGDQGNPVLLRAIRVHANAAENIPVVLLLMLLFELNGGGATGLHLAGGALVLGRLMHAWGMSRRHTVNPWRQGGVVLTWTVAMSLAVALLLRTVPAI